MMITPLYCYRWSLLLPCALLSVTVLAGEVCKPRSDSKYEAVFCQAKQSSYGRSLPSLGDFRRNPEKMQYLLLRQPASKLGVRLPPPANSAPVELKAETPVRQQKARSANQPAVGPAGDNCVTAIDRIRCDSGLYRRLKNQSNRHIAPAALGESNRLLLDRPGSSKDESDYLLAAYVQYVNKMISIGLAGSTFSYSAFAHTYYEHQRSGTDFVQRFRNMFEFLKQDKKNIGVSQRPLQRAPQWRECEVLNSELIACHSQGMNLLYQASR